ncbi:MAG: rod shape-determining protein RodA [Opitutia bacterium Tous-C10FEB]|jgi:rod shape determining protein RodA|nr:MAG: rod shape-determining protein RodA [Opitutae bacterium Tous-C10FEB]
MEKASRSIDLSNFFKVTTRERFDWMTPVCLVLLATFGVFFIYSAQMASGREQWEQQIVWLIAGAILYTATAFLDYRLWLRWSHWVYLFSLMLLLLVLVPGIGETRGMGARRWLGIGAFSFQPSESAKLAVLIMTAATLTGAKIGTVRDSLQTLIKLALAAGIPMVLILAEPDLGTALVLAPMVFAMLYISNLSSRFFTAAVGVFTLLVGLVALDTWRYATFLADNNFLKPQEARGQYEARSWLPLHDYQRERVLAFIAPDKIDPTGIGWNQHQSLISVGSGGLTGKGWTEGTQAKLGYLPRGIAHNDFIFSVIAEEKGFLGSITVIGLFGVVLWNGIRIAGLARDRFGALLALGVTVLIAVHVFVNIAMTIGLAPVTGIPLPFISYGGTFVLSCCFLQGLVQSVYRFRRDF